MTRTPNSTRGSLAARIEKATQGLYVTSSGPTFTLDEWNEVISALRGQQDERLRVLIHCASETLNQQRIEFERGEIGDLDRLEDALRAFDATQSEEKK